MKEKIITIACICVVLGWLYSKWDWYWPGKYEEMPVIVFLYNDVKDNAYAFSSTGDIYYFKYSSMPDDGIVCLEQSILLGTDVEWANIVGEVDVIEMQKQYNRFCKMIVKGRKHFYIHQEKISGPNRNNYDYGELPKYWTGFYKGRTWSIFRTGAENYYCSDERAYWIVDWINEQIESCGQ